MRAFACVRAEGWRSCDAHSDEADDVCLIVFCVCVHGRRGLYRATTMIDLYDLIV